MSRSAVRVSPVGRLLRDWRSARGMSQLELALAAGVAARHLSFIETGRSAPSREMLLLLSDVLGIPLRDQNALLLAAGFTAAYRATAWDAPDMEPARTALRFILDGHGANPAIALNGRYDIVDLNASAAVLLRLLVPSFTPSADPPNMLRLLLGEEGVRASLENWEELAATLVQRARGEALTRHARNDLSSLLSEVLGEARLPERVRQPAVTNAASPFLLVRLHLGDVRASLFSTITTLGGPLDVTLQELQIEAFFPADAESARALTRLTTPGADRPSDAPLPPR